MKKVTEIPPGYDTAPNYPAERVDEMQELGLQLGDAHAEIRERKEWAKVLVKENDDLCEIIEGLKAMQDAVDAGDGTLHNLIDKQAKELEGLMWLEQQHWDKDELFELVNNWKTKDGTRHPGGLMDAIDAAIAQQKETP